MDNKIKQLNPFEIKSVLIKLLAKINSLNDIQNCLGEIDTLDAQEDKSLLSKLLFKELINSPAPKIPVVCFLLEHFIPKDMLIAGLWDVLKNKNLKTDIRVMVLNMLRELDADWSYEDCSQYIEDAEDILDENTKQLLSSAVINPEVQIDFMDFMFSIKTDDKITLLNSFENDFDSDALANILIPVFESNPSSPEGLEALKMLGNTKSQLALHTLERMAKLTTGELNQSIRRSLATLKMAGIRQDNTEEFYKKILSNSKPEKFYVTYPDAHGDSAMIFTRKTDNNKIRFVSIVINLETGIKDCFGFYEISQFECDKILERFLKNEKVVSITPSGFKNILYNAEITTLNRQKNEWLLPYEYVCWKNLLVDIECEELPINQIVEKNIKPAQPNQNIINKLETMKISAHWFMDIEYSDEFSELIHCLKTENNLDKLITENFDKIYTEEEKQSWKEKLIFSTYIKHVIGKDDEASEIYTSVLDNNIFTQLLENILKRSIYEYLVLIKYNKDLNKEMFTDEDISFRIEYIEKNWVKSDV